MNETNGQEQPSIYRPHFTALIDSVDALGRKMDRLIALTDRPPDIRRETATLQTGPYVYESYGYKHLAIVSPSNFELLINLDGVKYSEFIKRGFNAVTLINGSDLSISAATPVSVILVRSTVKLGDSTPTDTLYGKSTDTKPTGVVRIGTTYLETDTSTVYVYDGTSWAVL